MLHLFNKARTAAKATLSVTGGLGSYFLVDLGLRNMGVKNGIGTNEVTFLQDQDEIKRDRKRPK